MTPLILKQLKEYIAANDMIRFYKSKEWRKLRAIAKKRDHNECQMCKANGKYSKGDMVHHIKEVKDNPELALALSNLQTLCNACHNKVHDKLPNQKKKFTNEERW
nr:HNH endonuclease signature motif containing protein [Pisciglobus halotolerans]